MILYLFMPIWMVYVLGFHKTFFGILLTVACMLWLSFWGVTAVFMAFMFEPASWAANINAHDNVTSQLLLHGWFMENLNDPNQSLGVMILKMPYMFIGDFLRSLVYINYNYFCTTFVVVEGIPLFWLIIHLIALAQGLGIIKYVPREIN